VAGEHACTSARKVERGDCQLSGAVEQPNQSSTDVREEAAAVCRLTSSDGQGHGQDWYLNGLQSVVVRQYKLCVVVDDDHWCKTQRQVN
jgi:hypothetical protein